MKKILFLVLPFLAFHLVALATAVPFSDEPGPLLVKGPDGALSFELIPGAKDLSFTVRAGKLAVVGLSPLRFSLDGVSLTEGAVIRDTRSYKLSEKTIIFSFVILPIFSIFLFSKASPGRPPFKLFSPKRQ